MRIEDIAREAGVSTATISRVLNNPELVKAETRERVLEVVRRHDYVPNSLARGLMTRQSMTVGVVIISITNAYYMEITETIQRRLRDAGFMMLLAATDDRAELERSYVREFVSRRADGIIVIDASAENFGDGFFGREAQRLPLVLVHSNEAILPSGIPQVFVDQRRGMRSVMEHLAGLGHASCAFLRGLHGFSYDLKEAAWAEWLAERGQSPDPRLVLRIEDGNSEDAIPFAEEAVGALIREGRLPSAIFAANDLMARGAVIALTKAGLRIPEDVSVVGHDDTILAVSGRVQLSSVDLKMRSVGMAAADLLLSALSGAATVAAPVLIEPEFIPRDSSGPAPGRGA
jgi:DNA-binding LacI/PurR family transcriptional regulator